jgi:hypothetical protein
MASRVTPRSPRRRAALRTAVLVLVGVSGAVLTAACSSVPPAFTYPPESAGPPSFGSPAGSVTEAMLIDVFGEHRFQVQDAQTPYRPAEGPALAGAFRHVVQVIIPDDPDGGYLVIYELRDAPTALAAGQDQAAYLASGPGRVQHPIGTRHIIRQVGSTLVLYAWHPEGSVGERTPEIEDILETIGVGITVPS